MKARNTYDLAQQLLDVLDAGKGILTDCERELVVAEYLGLLSEREISAWDEHVQACGHGCDLVAALRAEHIPANER